jgi:AcrR family transcriptional regulator
MAGLRARKKQRLRWVLVRAALRLFEERGFEQTTVEAIAAAAEVSPRTFFRYFSSKEDVILIDPVQKLARIDHALAAARPHEPILDILRRTWADFAEEYLSDVEITLATYRLSRAEPVLAARLLSFQTEWSHALARAISAQLGVDASTDIRPEVVASTSQAMLRSAFNRWAEAGCPGSPRDVVTSTFGAIGPALQVVLEQLEPAPPARARGRRSGRQESRVSPP